MSKYLLEVGVEELPYKFIPMAIEQLKQGFDSFLKDNGIDFSDIKVMATPRRLAVLISGLTLSQPDTEKVVKGPISTVAFDEQGNLTKAGEGFANRNGISKEDLYVQDNYVYAKISIKGKNTKELLQENVPSIFSKLQGPHFMRWGNNDVKFSRPIRWVLSILDNEEVPVKIIDKTSSNKTNGHRFSTQNIVINNPDEYISKLRDAKVIVDQDERKAKILELTKIEADKLNAVTKISDDLLEEVTFIVEYPVAVTCDFDTEYLTIPQEVAVTVMETHQRYFALYEKTGKLINKFITITNYIGNEFENIKAGNLRVIKARLDDAVFFFKEDTKKSLESYVEALKGMTFQKGLGSMYKKRERIIKLVNKIIDKSHEHYKTTIRTAELCKADLATNLVFEFTELQGFIGADYARVSGEDERVQAGIREHYFPLNAESEIAEGFEGRIVGIADKIDTICAVFAAGKKPTGSSDPLGARRAALGIIKTVLKMEDDINLSDLIGETLKTFKEDLTDLNIEKLQPEIEDFIIQRMYIYLNTMYDNNILKACSNKNPLANLKKYELKVKALSANINETLVENAKRVWRILKEDVNTDIKENLLVENAEKDLYKAMREIILSDDYNKFIDDLNGLNSYVTRFFDDVLVMDNDLNIRNNRLSLITGLRNLYAEIADFSLI